MVDLPKALITIGCVVIFGGCMLLFGGKAGVKVGDQAPDFSLPDQHGGVIKLSDFRAKKNVVLAFYIKAFTPG